MGVVLLAVHAFGVAVDPHHIGAASRGLWGFEGRTYDLRPWLRHHPGGSRVLLNTRGRDITRHIHSHHLGSGHTRVLDLIAAYEVHGLEWPPDPNGFAFSDNSTYMALSRDVCAVHDCNELLEPTAAYLAARMTTLCGAMATAAVAVRVQSAATAWAAHAMLGWLLAMLGGFAHNGLHLYSRRPFETHLMLAGLSLNPFQWMEQHMRHHMATNTLYDPDWAVTNPAHPVRMSCARPQGPGALCLVHQAWGTLIIGTLQTWVWPLRELAPALTGWEHMLPAMCQIGALVAGVRAVGLRFVPRMLLTMAVLSYVTFSLFAVSHVGAQELDGAGHAAASRGDWGAYQLRTAFGWGAQWGPWASFPFLFVNHQPLHHLFPTVHHSRLPALVPLVRRAYPGMLSDVGIGGIVAGFRGLYNTLHSSTVGARAWASHVHVHDDNPHQSRVEQGSNERVDERDDEL